MDKVGVRQIETASQWEGFIRDGQVTEPRHFGLEVTYKMGGYQ